MYRFHITGSRAIPEQTFEIQFRGDVGDRVACIKLNLKPLPKAHLALRITETGSIPDNEYPGQPRQFIIVDLTRLFDHP
jgi:hypothetical protein